MNRLDCSLGDNKQKMMFFRETNFNADVFNKKWDRIKIICRQPFKINNDCFGLAMFVLHGFKSDAIVEIPSINVSKSSSTSNVLSKGNGLEDFKKKAATMTTVLKSPYVPKVLKNLDNIRKVIDDESVNKSVKESTFSSTLSSSSMSRTAKLVVKGQNVSGKKFTFEDEAKDFLKSCGFEKKTFAEIESITFRNVRELWLERKKCELSKEEKDILKRMSGSFLTKLVQKTSKRPREKSDEKTPPKKRRISKQIENMRKNTDIDELYDDDSSTRNKIATKDIVKEKDDLEDEDDEIKSMRSKYNIKQSKLQSPKSNTSQFKMKELNKENPTFDLTSSPEVSPVKATPKNKRINKMLSSTLLTTVKDSKTGGGATFDLTSSPEISPIKNKPLETVTVPPVSASSKPIQYNRNHLLKVSHEVLIDHGVLVQVYNYKKDKKLPLKGKLELNAKKGVQVTFFKVGPDVHLEYQGRFFLPDILPEHLERVFKNFKPEQINKTSYPDNLESLLQISSKKQSEIIKEIEDVPSEEKVDESRIPSKKPDNLNDDEKEVQNKATSGSNKMEEEGTCPLCQKVFSIGSLVEHAAACNGPSSENSSGYTNS